MFEKVLMLIIVALVFIRSIVLVCKRVKKTSRCCTNCIYYGGGDGERCTLHEIHTPPGFQCPYHSFKEEKQHGWN